MSTPQSITTYTPESGSLTDRILNWFLLNPLEELTEGDIVAKFDCAANAVGPALTTPLAREILRREAGQGSRTVIAGPNFAGWRLTRKGSAVDKVASAEPEKPTRSKPPAPFDPKAIAVESCVVRPIIGRNASGVSVGKQIGELFDRLQPSTHAVLPWAYRHLAKDVCTRWRKANPGKNVGVVFDPKAEKVILNRYE